MEFENEFSVDAPIDEVYETLMDLQRVAPCMPGAQVLEHVSDDEYKVGIKVKLGPMTMTYRGDLEVTGRDAGAHSASMRVKAKESRGQGTATADVNMQLTGDAGETHAKIGTNVKLSGKAAAMGQGVIEEVSAKLVDQFAQNLAQMIEAAERPSEAPEPPRAAPPPPPQQQPAETLDALALASGVAADRMRNPRVLAGTLAAAVLLGYLLGRRAR
jgi:carbon monoxide dehydrogenase subunit G